jgi:hypothetical protein
MRGRILIAATLTAATLGAGGWALFAAGAGASPLATAPGCPIFPSTNVWNKRVDALGVDGNSGAMIDAIGRNIPVHPDFGSFQGYGIPINVVAGSQKKKHVTFDWYGPSPTTSATRSRSSRRSSGSDAHMLIVDRGHCRLYELYHVHKNRTGWHAGSGATWNLLGNHLRPDGWTSADAAGLPILPGLVRWNEVKKGVIDHALRVTVPDTCNDHIYPARHDAGSGSCLNNPPMGLRLRLRASFDVSQLSRQARVIAVAMQQYGIIVADNGSSWYVQGASNAHFNDDALRTLNHITGDDFVVVDTSTLRNG